MFNYHQENNDMEEMKLRSEIDTIWFNTLAFHVPCHTPRHELHTPGGGGPEPGVTGPIFWYVIAEVFLHNISSGVEIL